MEVASVTTLHLLELPVEIRYRIIESVLPSEYCVSEPVPKLIQCLLLVCKTLNADLKQVFRQWMPILVIPHPRHLAFGLPRAFDPVPLSNLTHHRLAIYHEAALSSPGNNLKLFGPEVGQFDTSASCDLDDYRLESDESNCTWENIPRRARVRQLPDLRVDIDITPAPGWLRDQYPQWVSAWMDESLAGPSFGYSGLGIEKLLKWINEIYQFPQVCVTGTLPYDSDLALQTMMSATYFTGIPVSFDTKMVCSKTEPNKHVCIEFAATNMVNKELESLSQKGTIAWSDRRFWAKVKDLVKLTQWDKDTEDLFKQRFRRDRQWTLKNLRQLLCFVANESYQMAFEPELRCRREMTSKLATCLQLMPKVRGVGFNKYIMLTRRKRNQRGPY